MSMTADDWQKMNELLKNHRLEERENIKLICAKQVTESIADHEGKSWSHNPKRALTLGALVIGLIEAVRKLFHAQ